MSADEQLVRHGWVYVPAEDARRLRLDELVFGSSFVRVDDNGVYRRVPPGAVATSEAKEG